MSRTRRRRRLVLGSLVVGAGALAGRAVLRRRPDVAAVAPELRNPILYLPFDLDARRLAMARALLRQVPLTPVTGIDVSERTVPRADGSPGPRVVLYRPAPGHEPAGALVWIHGGGMVMGCPEQEHRWCADLAAKLGIVVASVDYRLAPEHPFPAGLDDCMAALAWVHADADELGVDPERVAVGGGSAGGGLAAAVCQRARDEDGPPVCLQLLNYPMLDDRTLTQDGVDGRGVFTWTPTSNRFGWGAYLGHPPGGADAPPYAAPARTDDLSGLPPAWIGVGDLDLFHTEDLDYAHRLTEAGVACELYEQPGMYHGADQIAFRAPSMKAYRQAMVDALRAALCDVAPATA